MAQERLQKILAHAGIASRRHAEYIIAAGEVTVNGDVITTLGIKADSERDDIRVRGKKIQHEQYEYYIVNKPKGVISTVSDTHARTTVVSLVKTKARLYPVGRLDTDSRGLMILTNDGELAHTLSHPKFEHEKEYRVRVHQNKGSRNGLEELMRQLKKGIRLEEGVARADRVEIEKQNSPISATILITVHQGWKRQIRRMIDACGWYVGDLQRIRIGRVVLGDLEEGKSIQIVKEDIVV
ncbi:MAG TPA: pseudouridine synthase [Patescibacteria group bacterium]|nr:pseudouridine synthase [Patescibacteria group bacterium]